jgi:hypothetical protein
VSHAKKKIIIPKVYTNNMANRNNMNNNRVREKLYSLTTFLNMFLFDYSYGVVARYSCDADGVLSVRSCLSGHASLLQG